MAEEVGEEPISGGENENQEQAATETSPEENNDEVLAGDTAGGQQEEFALEGAPEEPGGMYEEPKEDEEGEPVLVSEGTSPEEQNILPVQEFTQIVEVVLDDDTIIPQDIDETPAVHYDAASIALTGEEDEGEGTEDVELSQRMSLKSVDDARRLSVHGARTASSLLHQKLSRTLSQASADRLKELTHDKSLVKVGREPADEDEESGYTRTRRQSIGYKPMSRFQDDEFGRRISGDFTAADFKPLIGSRTSIASYHSEEEEHHEEEEEEEEEPEVLDREPYYELHEKLTVEHLLLRMKNNFLHRKMADYFRKRNMEHVLRETDQIVDTQQKYGKRLDALGELMDLDDRQRTVINEELVEMRQQRDAKLASIRQRFRQMQNREKDISTGLIHSKTGKEIPEKLIERLLRRQKNASTQVAELRLRFIKIRNKVQEKQDALQALDKLGEGMRIIDFEQLKAENQSYADKIEERDEELTRLRAKCENSTQILAHLREKSASATLDMIDQQARMQEVEIECMEARERANYFKQERDHYRRMTERIRQECGLLTKPRLLQDMQDTINDVDRSTARLKELQKQHEKQNNQLRAIRRHIEMAPLTKAHHSQKDVDDGKLGDTPSKRRVHRGRPTWVYPVTLKELSVIHEESEQKE